MGKIDFSTLESQFRGTYTRQLVEKHVMSCKNDKGKIYDALYQTLQLLPWSVRPDAHDLINRYNESSIKATLMATDTAKVLGQIIEEVKTNYKLEIFGDEVLFNMFQVVILSYAYSEADKKSQHKRFIIYGNQTLLSNYVDIMSILSTVINENDTEEYKYQKSVAKKTFEITLNKNELYLGIVKGLNQGISLTQFDVNDPLCFPKRFLKMDSTAYLSPDKSALINITLERVFFLGFLTYLLYMNTPTPEKMIEINLNEFYNKWVIHSLVADKHTRGIDTQASGLFNHVLGYYYGNDIENMLKDQFKIGGFTLGQVKSYLIFLFNSGIYLGMCLDLTSSGVDFNDIK